jgi:hypothetical protein
MKLQQTYSTLRLLSEGSNVELQPDVSGLDQLETLSFDLRKGHLQLRMSPSFPETRSQTVFGIAGLLKLQNGSVLAAITAAVQVLHALLLDHHSLIFLLHSTTTTML